MIEYGVPEEYHIAMGQDPADLFTISISMLADLAAGINRSSLTSEELTEAQRELIFSANFLDTYVQTGLNESINGYVALLASASYYLAALPGSSRVLAQRLGEGMPGMGGQGIEHLLAWILAGGLSNAFEGAEGDYGEYIDSISQALVQHYRNGLGDQRLAGLSRRLRSLVYETGSPRELLLADVLAAVLKKKLENSSWLTIPAYSDMSSDTWRDALQKDTFIKEFWPAQHLLGRHGVLRGESAVVQMPTSAGKTKAVELIVRSAFLSERANLVVIVAPFRALCSEIKNSLHSAFRGEDVEVDELSDALQPDIDLGEIIGRKQILTVTPEKLLYLLRHLPDMAATIGLVIFDEGHQFDSGSRGITYELLLTSLRSVLPETAQKVLISAVISNASAIGEWLNGLGSQIVASKDLLPMFRSVGFVSWPLTLGQVQYISNDNDLEEYFVPRVIESVTLANRGRERKLRKFPDKSNPSSIALYLAFKLSPNGGVAIFCGQKATVIRTCKEAVDAIERGLPLPMPSDVSDQDELIRLHYLLVMHLGPDATSSRCALYGIFSHHGNTPRGIRLAVEHAMREDLIRFVVCTSTLAQGVNLPIRYLIVHGVRQGREAIKVRDFHNLIGRAGRAGIHTEGSILFADPRLFDGRGGPERWHWNKVKMLLDPNNSENCVSSLLSLLEPIKSEFQGTVFSEDAMEFVRAYVDNPNILTDLPQEIAKWHNNPQFKSNEVIWEISSRMGLFTAIESFLMSNSNAEDGTLSEQQALDLAEDTLAYFLAEEDEEGHVREIFALLAKHVSNSVTDPGKRIVYGRTLLGVRDAIAIDTWLVNNVNALSNTGSDDELLTLIWNVMDGHIKHSGLTNLDMAGIALDVAKSWVAGRTYHEIVLQFTSLDVDDLVDVCENAFGFQGVLVIAAMCDLLSVMEFDLRETIVDRLQVLQKKFKYGLPTRVSIEAYESGFPDRVIAQDLAAFVDISDASSFNLKAALRGQSGRSAEIIRKYPQYYQNRMSDILR